MSQTMRFELKPGKRNLEVIDGMYTELVTEDGDDRKHLELVNECWEVGCARYKTLVSTCPGTPEKLFLG